MRRCARRLLRLLLLRRQLTGDRMMAVSRVPRRRRRRTGDALVGRRRRRRRGVQRVLRRRRRRLRRIRRVGRPSAGGERREHVTHRRAIRTTLQSQQHQHRSPQTAAFNPPYLWSPYGIGQTIIFLPCGYYLSFFSSPNLSGRRLDVYHTSTHGVALVRI